MSTDRPSISVVTAVYNGADFLPELIESVQGQDYPHYEHIIIDDGSTDDGATVAVLERYAQDDSRVRWWTRENRGQYATQNEAIHAAKGDYIVVIAADDVFVTPDAFSQVVRYLKGHPDCEMVYGKSRRMGVEGNLLPDIIPVTRPSRWLIRHFCYVAHCSLFVSRQLLIKHDLLFDGSLRYAGDWDWIIRLFDSAEQITYLRQPLSIVRFHPDQASRTASGKDRHREYQRILKTYGGSRVVFYAIRRLVMFRGMILVALHILRESGFSAFLKAVKNSRALSIFRRERSV